MRTEEFGKKFAENLQKREEEYFTAGTTVFNFIPADLNDTSQWRKWRADQQEHIPVPGSLFQIMRYGIDGLVASMGAFTLCALPRGTVEFDEKTHKYKITITHVAVYAQDGFNFEGAELLGFWNCTEKVFSPADPEVGRLLGNHSFRKFRIDTGYGGNFRIFASPRMVDLGEVIVHDLSL